MLTNGDHKEKKLLDGQKNVSKKMLGFATKAVHVGHQIDEWPYREIVPPISLSTTFKQDSPAEPNKYDYIRAGNSTRDCLEKCLAALENAEYCRVFASGLAATMAISGLLKQGDHIVCSDDVYGGTQRYFRRILVKNGIKTSMVDMTDLETVRQNILPETKLVWIESPTNPLLKVADIKSICDLVKKINPNIYTVVDNTFMSPFFQKPLELGVDIVLHSITKYINGHSDVLMGCACTNNSEIYQHLTFYQLAVGCTPSPFDCYLVNRGVKTLHVRMQRHMENATAVANFLENHPNIEKVFYPELSSHPQHAVHKKQTTGMSGMLSFYLKGNLNETKTFLKLLKFFVLAESLGGYESLIEHPALMTHASVPLEERLRLGIGDNLIRVSIGLEDVKDLIQDLDYALSNYKSIQEGQNGHKN